MKKLKLSQLKYSGMREELIDYIDGLSNKEYQHQAWVEDKRPGGEHDELDYAVHFLYDDTDLADDPGSMIGWILTGEDEVSAITRLVDALNTVFNTYGIELTDKEYIAKNE